MIDVLIVWSSESNRNLCLKVVKTWFLCLERQKIEGGEERGLSDGEVAPARLRGKVNAQHDKNRTSAVSRLDDKA
jgi:hypothetical protein